MFRIRLKGLSKVKWEYFIITFYGVFGCWLITFLVINTHFLNPLEEAFADFRFSDIYYSQVKCKNSGIKVDSPVILVDVDSMDRSGITQLMKSLNDVAPAVVAIDVVFKKFNDNAEDSALLAELQRCPNLVMTYSDSSEVMPYGRKSSPSFGSYSSGFDNFVGNDYRHSTIRSFYPFVGDSQAFSLKIAERYEYFLAKKGKAATPSAKESMLAFIGDDKHEPVEINYSGNAHNFLTFYPRQFFHSPFNWNVFNDKIVILGSVSNTERDSSTTLYINDQFFTPLNSKISGRSLPDMHGVEIHANIVQMLLDRAFVRKLSSPWSWLLAYFICLLMLPLFLFFYTKHYTWFHASSKAIELTVAVVLIIIFFFLLHYFLFKMELEIPLLCVFLFATTLYFYDGTVKIINKLFRYFKMEFQINSILTKHH